jgi:hypothetical protein
MMEESKLDSQPAVLNMTIQITRKETGKVEEYKVIGTPIETEPKKEPE